MPELSHVLPLVVWTLPAVLAVAGPTGQQRLGDNLVTNGDFARERAGWRIEGAPAVTFPAGDDGVKYLCAAFEAPGHQFIVKQHHQVSDRKGQRFLLSGQFRVEPPSATGFRLMIRLRLWGRKGFIGDANWGQFVLSDDGKRFVSVALTQARSPLPDFTEQNPWTTLAVEGHGAIPDSASGMEVIVHCVAPEGIRLYAHDIGLREILPDPVRVRPLSRVYTTSDRFLSISAALTKTAPGTPTDYALLARLKPLGAASSAAAPELVGRFGPSGAAQISIPTEQIAPDEYVLTLELKDKEGSVVHRIRHEAEIIEGPF